MQKSYCYTPGVRVSVRVGVGVHMQNVRANVKVWEFKSFCICSCILSLLIILIKPLTTKAYDRRASGDCGTSGLLLLWNRGTEFNETWQEARSQRPLPSLCFSGRSEKQDGRPGLWLADTFSTSPLETAERNSMKLDWKQDLNVLYQICVFRADRKNKMAALASDWLIYNRFLLWNRWMEFNETWQEARSHRPLPSLCFSGRWEKQDGRHGLW